MNVCDSKVVSCNEANYLFFFEKRTNVALAFVGVTPKVAN